MEYQSLLLLGRQPALGLAELETLYGPDGLQSNGAIALLMRSPSEIDFGRLGGSRKLAQVLAAYPLTDFDKVHKQLTKDRIVKAALPTSGKLTLGLSAIGFTISQDKLFAAGLTLKKIFKSADRSVRLVPFDKAAADPTLSSAQVLHNGLSGPQGCELLLVRQANQTIIARTVAEQDITAYTKRDRERPKRDSKVGMLPPKLAQIIVNLASDKLETGTTNLGEQQQLLLDPFCGSGVILQEALLMGYAVAGSDLEPRMTAYAQHNLDWLAQTYPNVAGQWQLTSGDATEHQWDPAPRLIASECYLGRPFTQAPDRETLAKTMTDCNLIIKKFLRNLSPQIAPATALCLAVPAWQVAPGAFRYLPLVDQLSDLGYTRSSFRYVRDANLLYYRPDQIVARQLLILRKT